MGFKMGIVGLPNVGKSTLFNALTKTAAAQAANFPFCTIEPNVGDVAVPDARLDTLAGIAQSKQIIPTRMTFVDIAGLVKGASKGEGLGNQFLANIRECDAIAHVLRCFEDDDITHVEGREAAAEPDPQSARRRQRSGRSGAPAGTCKSSYRRRQTSAHRADRRRRRQTVENAATADDQTGALCVQR